MTKIISIFILLVFIFTRLTYGAKCLRIVSPEENGVASSIGTALPQHAAAQGVTVYRSVPVTSALISLGGNFLVGPGEDGTEDEQLKNLRATFDNENIMEMLRPKNGIGSIITHGNGPQAGMLLDGIKDVLKGLVNNGVVEQTQNDIGGLIKKVLVEKGIPKEKIKVVITHVKVDSKDPAFKNPTKPIGRKPKIGKDTRTLVPSPFPLEIVELGEIAQLIRDGFVVICVGGGGILVDKDTGEVLPGVIDKDLATAVLVNDLRKKEKINIPRPVISTNVDYVRKNKGKGEIIKTLTPQEAWLMHNRHIGEGMSTKLFGSMMMVENGAESVQTTVSDYVVTDKGTFFVPEIEAPSNASGQLQQDV